MLDVKAELDSLCKDQQDELVGQTLLKNDWQYKVQLRNSIWGGSDFLQFVSDFGVT